MPDSPIDTAGQLTTGGHSSKALPTAPVGAAEPGREQGRLAADAATGGSGRWDDAGCGWKGGAGTAPSIILPPNCVPTLGSARILEFPEPVAEEICAAAAGMPVSPTAAIVRSELAQTDP